jgi:WD40 repeat protein
MYKVFLSSTSRDLADYREAVHRAIDGLPGLSLVKMEDFAARDASAKDLCARLVRECDLLVGLMGHYYGSCPPGDTISFTELEYRTATTAGLSRLMFVAPDDFPIPARLREPDASFERQQRFRQEIMADRVAGSFDEPQQLASAVTKSLFVWLEERRQQAAATGLAEAPVPFAGVAQAEQPLGENPYRGLEAFRKEDAARFFGREALVEKLWQAFIALHGSPADGETPMRLLTVLGPSGCGKSSVAHAGLLAELDERPLPGRPAAPLVVFSPEARPLESLAVALARQATGDPAPAGKTMEFERVLRERPDADGLRFLAAQMLSKAGIVLLVDQFEETYALCENEAERGAFIDNLLNAARAPNGRVSIVLTLRSDFLGAVNHHPELSRLIARQNVVVPVMGEAELRRAIAEPARAAGQEIDQSTVDLLIEQTLGREGALPALEFVLTRIWDGFRKGVSSADTVRELGGVGGALAREAERLYQSLNDEQKAVARRAFLAMTMLGEGAKDTRRRAPIDDIVAAGQSEADVRGVLEIFADPDRRLITLAADKDGKIIAEVAHEALFDHWSELRRWLDHDRDSIRFARRLEGAVKEWIDSGRSKGMLWRPPLLDLLRGYARDKTGEMPGAQLEFFEASERQRQRAIWTWRAGIAAAIVGLLIIAGGSILYSRQKAEFAQRQTGLRQVAETAKNEAVRQAQAAKDEKERADAQRDEALKTQSLFLAELSEQESNAGKATNGILLALEALPKDMDRPERPYAVEAEAALYGAVVKYRGLDVLGVHVDPVYSAAFSPDGTRVVTASADGTARLWNAAAKVSAPDALEGPLEGHRDRVYSAAFSADGTRVVTGSADYTARLWDAASGEALATLEGHRGPVYSAAFSADGMRVVTTSADHTARLWDAASGKALATLEGHRDAVESAAFSADGTRVVTASADYTARLWDAASGKALATLEGHRAPVLRAAFSADGTRVVTTSADHTARLWDAASGEAVATLEGHRGPVYSADFSADGTRVVTASADGTAKIWRVFQTTQELIDYARGIVPRQLTPEQRKQFFLE